MVITWFGLSCFKISSGNLSLLTDPFSKSTGLTPPRGRTDLALVSTPENLANTDRAETFVIDGPGEFDVKELFVHGIAASNATIFAVRMEDIRLGFLGALKTGKLTDEQLEDLGEIDILFVPVGGRSVCDADEAASIVNQIEPRLIVPMHYQQSGLKLSLDKLEPFLKEFGAAKMEPQDKLTIKKSAFIDTGSTQVAILTPQR